MTPPKDEPTERPSTRSLYFLAGVLLGAVLVGTWTQSPESMLSALAALTVTWALFVVGGILGLLLVAGALLGGFLFFVVGLVIVGAIADRLG